MSTRKVNYRKTINWALIYGGTLGCVLMALSVFNYTSETLKNDQTLFLLNYLIRIFGLIFCMSSYSRTVLKRRMNFEQGFFFGIFTFLIAMIIVELVVCAYFNLYPELILRKIAVVRQHLIKIGVDQATIEKYTKSLLQIKNPLLTFLTFSVWTLFIGPFISLCASTVLMYKERIIRIRKIRKRIPPKVQIGPTISNIVLKDQEDQ